VDGVPRVQRELVRLRDRRGYERPESDLDRTLRNRAQSDVYKRVIYLIGLSLALGSYWGLIASVLVILGFVFRLFDEEKFLAQDLPGYKEYQAKVRWHLIPGIF
jgi:hypothetical protein